MIHWQHGMPVECIDARWGDAIATDAFRPVLGGTYTIDDVVCRKDVRGEIGLGLIEAGDRGDWYSAEHFRPVGRSGRGQG